MEKAVKLEIKLDFPLMVPDLVYKFQMICIRGNEVKECKPNVGQTYKCTYITNGDVIFCYINNC
jgi:hypothetical protein